MHFPMGQPFGFGQQVMFSVGKLNAVLNMQFSTGQPFMFGNLTTCQLSYRPTIDFYKFHRLAYGKMHILGFCILLARPTPQSVFGAKYNILCEFRKRGWWGHVFQGSRFFIVVYSCSSCCVVGGHNCLCCGCQGLSLYMGHWFRSEQCRFPIGQPLTCGKQLIMCQENSVLFKTMQCPTDQQFCFFGKQVVVVGTSVLFWKCAVFP